MESQSSETRANHRMISSQGSKEPEHLPEPPPIYGAEFSSSSSALFAKQVGNKNPINDLNKAESATEIGGFTT